MARKQSFVEKFTSQCLSATPEELEVMRDILRGMTSNRRPAQPRIARQPRVGKQQKPNSHLVETVAGAEIA